MTLGPPPFPPRPGETIPGADLIRVLARTIVEELTREHRRGLQWSMFRQVEIATIDPATATATLYVGGDTDNPTPPVKTLPSYVPRVGDVPWAIQNGTDYLLVGGPGLELPKVEIRKAATSAITSGDTNAYIDFGATPTFYGGDRYGMYDPANSRFVFPWPGAYELEYQGHWTEAEGGRRIAEFEDQDGFIRASDRVEWDTTDTAPKDYVSNPHRTHRFAAGQWVKVKVFQSSGAPLSIQDEPFSNIAAVTYHP